MDSYDLFGEDVGGSMLDGLPDLGTDNFEPTPQQRENAGTAQGSYPHQPYQMHQPDLHQESPLQKLASFGGDFTSAAPNHMQSDPSMFHQNHRGYDSTPRAICPTNTSSSYGRAMIPQQHDMRRAGAPPATGNQYAPYCGPTDNLYGMDQSQGMPDSSLQGWNSGHAYPGPMRHYNQMGPPNAYRQQHMYQQENPLAGQQKIGQPQFSSSQQALMNPMMGSHQNMASSNSYQRQQPCYPQQNMVYPGSSGYPGYNVHQQTPRMPPHHLQYSGQVDLAGSQPGAPYNHMQGLSGQIAHPGFPQQQQMTRPIGIEVSGASQYPGGTPAPNPVTSVATAAPTKSITQGSPQPQYRPPTAPFPQLSPQMSPRPQMSPSRPQMSPRPVMSPAKPTTLSPHPHSQQTTLSPRPATALTPKASGAPTTTYPQQTTLQQLEQMVMPPVSSSSSEYSSFRGGPQATPPHWQPARPINGGMGMMEQGMPPFMPPEESRSMDPPKPVPLSTQQMPGSLGGVVDMNLQPPTTAVSESSVPTSNAGFTSPHHAPQPATPQPPPPSPKTHSKPPTPQAQETFSSPPHLTQTETRSPQNIDHNKPPQLTPATVMANTTLDPVTGNMVSTTTNSFGNIQYPNNKPEDDARDLTGMSGPPDIGPPHQPTLYPTPDQSRPPMFQSPIGHQQEMAALQQQLQEAYCMPPTPEVQMRGPGKGKGRGKGSGTPRVRKSRKKNDDQAPMIFPPQLQENVNMMPPMEESGGMLDTPHYPAANQLDGPEPTDPEIDSDEPPPVLEPCLPPPMADNSVFNFTEDEEPPPPLHGEGSKKIKTPRKPRKTREPKTPKEPKPPKEPKIKTPKTPKIKTPRKKREPKVPVETGEKGKRKSLKKKKIEEVEEDPSIIEDEEIDVAQDEMPLDELAERESEAKDDQTDIDLNEEEETETVKEEDQAEIDSDDGDNSIALKATPSPKKNKREKRSKGRPPRQAKTAANLKKKKSKVTSQDSDGDMIPSDEDNNKRRSARNTQRKKYVDDIMLAMSDDESSKSSPKLDSAKQQSPDSTDSPVVKPNFVYINTTDEDSMVVQHILAVRKGRREMKDIQKLQSGVDKLKEGSEDNEADKSEGKENIKCDDTPQQVAPFQDQTSEQKPFELTDSQNKLVDVEEYYVKYRNFSYLHCEWKTEDELYKGDKRIAAKLKRFKQKMAHHANIFENLEEDPFNPDYVEVDRVLDMAEHTDPNTDKSIKHYLVKWRSLQYEDSTWELEEDIDPIKIQQYHRFNKLPPKDQWKPKKKPDPGDWEKMEESPIYNNDNILRAYQLEGLNWLLFSWYNGRNCILADEMGLGKTIQSLTFINAVHEYGIRGPFLVIAPLSTIPNWQREFEAWTDLNVIVYHGSSASRNMLQEYEMYFRNDKRNIIKDLPKFNVLITTFEIIITDFHDLKEFHWRLCVIDEAHRLKNRNCKLLEGLRTLNLEHRVLLSGTPLQNNVNELFSLLNFLEPQQFTSSDAFLQEFGALKTENEVQKLQLLLKPMMLRRLKEDVEKTIAPKEETVVEVELTNIQKKYYRGILERNFSFLSKGTTSANVPNLMNTMMELRKCCIHPYLLNGAEDQIQHDFRVAHGDDPDAYYKALINSSGKMVLIDKLLPKLKSGGHRVLVFSQMVRCLDILEDYLVFRKYPFERIDGRIRGNLRQAAIDRFCRPDSDRFVFLLCTKAGGLGINLTAADTVIIYDSDWNPQNDLQAQARCHRIGQQKMVKVYRLLCRNTYEREMFDKASLKLGLDKAILQSMNTSQGGKEINNKQLSKKEIEDLLKKGAYGAIMEEDSAADKFCEEDIDQILERRTQIITLESEKGSTFSKASFASSGIRADIDIDDPDFWKKWAKRADIDTAERGELNELVISEPRRRTQIKRYGHDENVMDMSDLESTSGDEENEDNDTSIGVGRGRGSRKHRKLKKLKQKFFPEDYVPKEGEVTYGAWSRSECFKVERGMLTFGWGRWGDILSHGQFRDGWKESDVEDVARIIMLYCLRYYRGDDKIRSFIWDLITPVENGESTIPRNHMGLHSPVPRGGRRKLKIKMKEAKILGATSSEPLETDHWSRNDKYDGDLFLESTYKKHLARHANKVLLRVRMLYYIKHEILGDLVHHISDGQQASVLPIYPPHCDQAPAPWWDRDADRSLVVGTYKHGYENYSQMRSDPALSFLARCGPPTHSVGEEKELGKLSDEEEGSEATGGPSEPATPNPAMPGEEGGQATSDEDPSKPQWPASQDLNSRLRRVITSYQRNFKKEELKLAQKAKPTEPHAAAVEAINQQLGTNWDWHQLAMYLWKVEKREKYELIARERERQRQEINQRKWSRREEQDFYRTISTFGVEFDRQRNRFDWNKFKTISRLEKKFDESMTEYYKAFVAMCKRVCCMRLSEDEENLDQYVEPLPEDKARRTLERINLLSKIREEILPHPQLDERLRLCQLSADVPEWWVAGKHDKDLLIGVTKHGLGRTDFFILNDPELSFREIVRKNMISIKSEASGNALKLERPEDILKLDRNEIVVKLEKGEGTLKIEKIGTNPLKSEEDGSVKHELTDSASVKVEPSETIEDSVKSDCDASVKEEVEEDSCARTEVAGEPKCDLQSTTSDIDKTEPINSQCSPLVENESFEELKQGTDTQQSENINNCDTLKKTLEAPPMDAVPQEMEVDKHASKDDTDLCEASENTNVDNKNVNSPNDVDMDVAKVEEPLCEKLEKDTTEEDRKSAEVKMETGSVKSESDKNSLKEENKSDLSVCTDLLKGSSSGNTEVVDRFKAMFPELEVMHRFPDIDTTVVADKQSTIAQLLQQSYQNPIKWPKDHALQVRLQHIVHCVEHKEWPVTRQFSAYTGGTMSSTQEGDQDNVDTPASTPRSQSEGSEVITITTDHSSRQANTPLNKRKRHIAIDVETERAKLHALLNSSNMQMSHMMKHSPAPPWDNDESLSEDSRRSTPVTQNLQPPPAHQQSHQSSRVLSMPFDLKYHSPTPTLIPGTTSTLTPIDLSSSVSKSLDATRAGTSKDTTSSMDEVQDFSMPSKNKQPQQTKSKLDDMLNKLMQKNNCPVPVEQPVVGKERKKKKLDEIVMGLSAAKEQQVEPKKVQPNVSVTVTKSAPNTKSTFLAQAEQHNLMLKQQQQLQQQLLQQQQAIKMAQPNSATAAHVQRRTYEAMIADISKVADFSAKISSYSHEAKVNKWLAEQTSMIPEQSLGADFMSAPRRRRPRVDPTLLDWKKLTGEENVSVINRMTGKKLTGNKAPQLKRLAQWLMENPMYDVDPKWAELVKERGKLPLDLQNRLPQSDRKKGPGRPPLLSSPPRSQTPSSQASTTLPTANLPFPSLATGLGGINPSTLLSGLSLGAFTDQKNNPLFDPKNNPLLDPKNSHLFDPKNNPLFDPKNNPLLDPKNNPLFDPKNNPLLLPFGGMSNMSALGGLGNMSLTNSLFANLAGLGLPSLTGMESSLTNPPTSSSSPSTDPKTSKSHKSDNKSTSKATPVSSSAPTLPTSLPFFFPNPSLLYGSVPMGLSGLNPFSLQPGAMSSAYDSLALLNGGLGVSSSQGQSRTHKGTTSTTSVSSGRASTVTSASTSQSKQQSQQRLPAQFLLPHDTHLLESLTRSTKPKQQRSSSSYSRDQEMKEALEALSKSSTELLPRMPHEERSLKRGREEVFSPPVDLAGSIKGTSPNPMAKKIKESPEPSPAPNNPSSFAGGLDLSSHYAPEERAKTPPPLPTPPPLAKPENPVPPAIDRLSNDNVNDRPVSPERITQVATIELETRHEEMCDAPHTNEESSLPPSETKDDCTEGEGEGELTSSGIKGKKRRGKKSLDVGERKMLRSSAGRAAAAAARARENHSN